MDTFFSDLNHCTLWADKTERVLWIEFCLYEKTSKFKNNNWPSEIEMFQRAYSFRKNLYTFSSRGIISEI